MIEGYIGIGFGLLLHPAFTIYRLHGIFLILISAAEHIDALLKSREYDKYYKNIKGALLSMRSRKSYK